MLDLQPAKGRPGPSKGRIGLALAGGGPLGAFYEVGCLHAIEEACHGLRLTELDMYMGVSSGAMITAGLANGFDTADMGVVFIHNASAEYPVTPGLFLQPAIREYARRLASAPGLPAIALDYLRDPGKDWSEMLDPLGRLLPTGVFDNRPFERFLAHLFSTNGRTNDFRALPARLYVVATELNSGHSVRFGEPGYDHVPISRAIQASTALPGSVPAGRDRRSHLCRRRADAHDECFAAARRRRRSRHLRQPAGGVRCIERPGAPRLPATGVRPHARRSADSVVADVPVDDPVAHEGRYGGLQAAVPATDMLLIEPDRGDRELFFQNIFRYADRKRLAEHAYRARDMTCARKSTQLARMLKRHDITLSMPVLEDVTRSFGRAVRERRRRSSTDGSAACGAGSPGCRGRSPGIDA